MSNRQVCRPCGTLWTSYPANRTWRITKAQNRAVTTCWIPLQTVEKSDIQQHLINQDTMSALTSDTLVSCAEPPPFGYTDIILEQTFEY